MPYQIDTSDLLTEAARPPLDALRLYLAYRLGLALLLVGVLVVSGHSVLGQQHPALATFIIIILLVESALNWTLNILHKANPASLCHLAIYLDIVALTLLLHASGGTASGLGILLIVSIALASLSLVGRTALLFAALASLAVITETLVAQFDGRGSTAGYTQAGLLGGTFFAVALLAHRLGDRIQRSERLARERGTELASLAELNAYIVDRLQTGVLVVDPQHRLQQANDATWRLLGLSPATADTPLRQFASKLDQRLSQWSLTTTFDDPGSLQGPGNGRDLTAHFVPLGVQGKTGTLIFLEDAAGTNERAQQLKLASLGRLTASIAHEIRNPLGAISHAGQLLGESEHLNGGDRRMVQIIQDNCQRVDSVIGNVLELSRRQTRTVRDLPLGGWLRDFARDLRERHHLLRGQVVIQSHAEEHFVQTDPEQLHQVLDILCDNAIRHFDRDPAELVLHLRVERSSEQAPLRLDIADNGPGIRADIAEQVFEPFYSSRRDGTGLGLYIARELAGLNLIRLSLLPSREPGATFRLSFPAAQPLAAD